MSRTAALFLVPAVLALAAACSSGDKKATPSPSGATSTARATVVEGTPSPEPERINGVPVVPLRAGAPIDLPPGTVFYVEGGCTQCDGPATTLDRVYVDRAGTLHGDRLFERPLPVRDGRIIEENYITSMAVSPDGSSMLVAVCDRSYCGGVGNIAEGAHVTVYGSVDGGISWATVAEFEGGVWVLAAYRAAGAGGVVRHVTIAPDGSVAKTEYLALGRGGAKPFEIEGVTDLANANVIAVGAIPLVVGDNGTSLLWPPGGSSPMVDPQLPPGSAVTDGRYSPPGAKEIFLVRWITASEGGQRSFLGLLDKRAGAPVRVFGESPEVSLARLGAWFAPSTLATNGTLPTAALDNPKAISGSVTGVAALVDLETGGTRAIRQLVERRLGGDRTRILAAVPGPFVRVQNAGDCLNVREAASKSARILGCFKDGVLLKDRGETRQAEGLTWVGVETPEGAPGWASAEFLDVAGRAMGVAPLGHPRGTRTGDAGIDAVIAALESGDRAAISTVVQFQSVGCTHEAGLGGPPKCPEGVAEGTKFDVLPAGGCEGSWFPKEDFVSGEGGRLFAESYSKTLVYAVYRQKPPVAGQERWPAGDAIIVYVREMGSERWASTIGVTDGHIVSTWGGCGTKPDGAVKDVAPGDFILAPPR